LIGKFTGALGDIAGIISYSQVHFLIFFGDRCKGIQFAITQESQQRKSGCADQ
jgi:hypothetical protein